MAVLNPQFGLAPLTSKLRRPKLNDAECRDVFINFFCLISYVKAIVSDLSESLCCVFFPDYMQYLQPNYVTEFSVQLIMSSFLKNIFYWYHFLLNILHRTIYQFFYIFIFILIKSLLLQISFRFFDNKTWRNSILNKRC